MTTHTHSVAPFRPRRLRLVAVLALVALVAAPASGLAQSRRGHAAPRGSVRSDRSRASRPPSRSYYSPRLYRPTVNLGFFYGYPGYYGAYRYGRPVYGYYGRPYDYRWSAPYGYGYDGYGGRPYGGLRIDLPQRDAEVYVDDYFVGIVDDFDGVLQQANLEAGPHRIEVRDPDFDSIFFDVRVEPGRTITYRGSLRPRR